MHRLGHRIPLAGVLAIVVAGSSVLAGAARSGPVSARQDRASENHLLAICIDGLQAEAFETLLEEGRLPAIAGLLSRFRSARGRALASFPSSTAPSIPEILTGRYADRTPAMPRSIHAFDRVTSRARRYSLEPGAWEDGTPTLFTLLDAQGDDSISLFEGRFEGSDSWSSRRAILWGGALEMLRLPIYNPDRSIVRRFRRMVEAHGAPPRAAFLMLSSVDLAGHVRGPDSRRYRRAIEEADEVLGDLFDWMSRFRMENGDSYLDRTTVVIFGDHGIEPAPRFVPVESVLEHHGLKVVDLGTLYQMAFREKISPRWAERPDAVLAPGGSNVTQVYLRTNDGSWGSEPAGPAATEAIAEALEQVDGVEFVIRRVRADSIEVLSKGRCRASLTEKEVGGDRTFAYVVAPGCGIDPLGYLDDADAASLVSVADRVTPEAFHDIDEWKRHTRDTEFPLAVPLLLKGCASGPTQGDLVLTSEPGWSFLRHGKGDHGGLRRESVETELLFAGNAIREGATLDGARLIDLLPTFLDLLGVPADPAFLASLDGRALPVVRRPAPPLIAKENAPPDAVPPLFFWERNLP